MSFVAIVMGSASDMEVMVQAEAELQSFGIAFRTAVRSAHRQPKALEEFIASCEADGVSVYICAAGMSAALPGVVAASTTKPVIGVPIGGRSLGGLDALLSVAQMPPGIPVACVAVNGARNAAILAVEILALADPELLDRLKTFREGQAEVK